MSGILSSPTLNVPHLSIETSSSTAELKVRMGRARSSSLLKVETVGQNGQEEDLDQNLYENVNAEWVNRKGTHFLCRLSAVPHNLFVIQGAWLIHPLLIFTGKIVVDTIPGMRQEVSWTLVNLFYLGVGSHQGCCAPSPSSHFSAAFLPYVPLRDRNSFPVRLA